MTDIVERGPVIADFLRHTGNADMAEWVEHRDSEITSLREQLAREIWKPISAAKKDGSYEWIGRAGDFPFVDFMRWNTRKRRWEFPDGSHLVKNPIYGELFVHPLPSEATLQALKGTDHE